ncbi:MAG: hypothetical protein N3B15_01240 [Planctomycetota bacterium]|nr:hypothetical protein [Planctomycetota bacterium]
MDRTPSFRQAQLCRPALWEPSGATAWAEATAGGSSDGLTTFF